MREIFPMAGGCCLAMLALLTPLGAQEPDCSSYALYSLSPNMSEKEVRKIMGSKWHSETETAGPSGVRTTVEYVRGASSVYVGYDGRISGNPRVAFVRARVAETPEDGVVESLRERLGEPTDGVEHLEDGLRGGAVRWINERCGLEVEAYRQTEWWDRRQGSLYVQLRPWSAGAADTGAAEESAGLLGSGAPRQEASTDQVGASSAQTDGSVFDQQGFTSPVRTFYVAPEYPDRARRFRVTGRVSLEVVVRENGSVGDVAVVRATRTGLGFEEAAVEAVRQWRYRPATLDGTPVEASISVVVSFE